MLKLLQSLNPLVLLIIATLFVVWQIINFIAFGTAPTLPVLFGGELVVCGGLVIEYWKPA